MSLYLVVNTTQSQMRKIEQKLVMAKIDLPLEKNTSPKFQYP